MQCTCGKMSVGESRNWNENCPEHGLESEWYETTGKAKFKAQWDRAVEMQLLAREARNKRNKDV